jgi:hypothetical protein
MTSLTLDEQTRVRTALRFLRSRCGTWALVAKALGINETSLQNVIYGKRGVSGDVAVRVARFAKVSVDDVLSGRFPAKDACPHCGQRRVEPLDESFHSEANG